jgi:phage gp36-like protein
VAHYATEEDIVALYGMAQLVMVSDRDNDRQPDPGVVDAGLQAADDTINQYLSSQYTVPITPVPGSLRKLAIDIALYTMALGRAVRTEEMRIRYEDAIATLKLMAKGTIGIGLPPVDSDGDGTPDTNPNRTRRGRVIDIGRG